MSIATKVLAWYTAVIVVISSFLGIATIGQTMVATPGGAILAVAFNVPIVVFAMLVLTGKR